MRLREIEASDAAGGAGLDAMPTPDVGCAHVPGSRQAASSLSLLYLILSPRSLLRRVPCRLSNVVFMQSRSHRKHHRNHARGVGRHCFHSMRRAARGPERCTEEGSAYRRRLGV